MGLVAAVAVALLVLPWVIALALAHHHHLDATAAGILAAVSIPLSGLWLTWVTLAKGEGSGTPASSPSMAAVADQLAFAVTKQWIDEEAIRRLNDPYPLPVSWKAADPSLTDAWYSLVELATSGIGWPPPPPAGTWAASPDELAGKGPEWAGAAVGFLLLAGNFGGVVLDSKHQGTPNAPGARVMSPNEAMITGLSRQVACHPASSGGRGRRG